MGESLASCSVQKSRKTHGFLQEVAEIMRNDRKTPHTVTSQLLKALNRALRQQIETDVVVSQMFRRLRWKLLGPILADGEHFLYIHSPTGYFSWKPQWCRCLYRNYAATWRKSKKGKRLKMH